MEPIVQNLAASVVVGIFGTIACGTKWLLDHEREFPREKYPLTDDDQWRGTRFGASMGAAWLLVDVILHLCWQKPFWLLSSWEIRLSMFAALTLGGRFTLGEVNRVLRCRKGTPSRLTKLDKSI